MRVDRGNAPGMAGGNDQTVATARSAKRLSSAIEVDDMSYDFSRYLKLPGRRVVVIGGVLSGLVYVYFVMLPYITTIIPTLWQWGPLCIDAPRPESSRCYSRKLCRPHLPGVEVIRVEANEVFSMPPVPIWGADPNRSSYFAPSLDPIDFCNITITYTHPGFNDEVHVSLHLPHKSKWNGRFQGVGGGGFMVSLGELALFAPVARGFAAAGTDGGVPTGDPSDWALASSGNVDLNTLHTYGVTAIADMSVIGQQLTHYYYGKAPKYSYWNGCSTGGRQGIQLAQSHPYLYDGILASAPALHIPSLATGMYWPQILMQDMQAWPQPCELQALTAAAIDMCDRLDGVIDGIISAPEKCKAVFDPFKFVNTTAPCPADPSDLITISPTAASLVASIWSGPATSDGYQLFPPLSLEASLMALAATTCTKFDAANPHSSCCGLPNILAAQWVQLFLLRKHFPPSTTVFRHMEHRYLTSTDSNRYIDLFALTRKDYDELFAMANREYRSIVGSDDPDLSSFARLGGKMITWHGLADDLIPPGGSVEYYESVLQHFKKFEKSYQSHAKRNKLADMYPLANEQDIGAGRHNSGESAVRGAAGSVQDVTDFYRLYLAPGVSHCLNGPGPYPGMAWDSKGALDQLIAWVENGTSPDTLNAVSNGDDEGRRWRRPLCMWPKVARYRGKREHERDAEGWVCEDQE